MSKANLSDRPPCPKCGSTHVISKHPQFRCQNPKCRHAWLKDGEGSTQKPKILLFDIETSPLMVLVWGLYKQRIPNANIVKEWAILSWAAKWLFDSEIISAVVSPEEAVERKDKSIIESLWDLLDQADIVVAQNGVKFDVRKVNARFKLNGLGPPMSYQIIDTMRIAQKNMAFSSYSLDYLNKLFENTRKLKTEYGLWKRCIGLHGRDKQKKALKQMVTYNQQDVVALEELYLELRPWVKGPMNFGLYYDLDNSQAHCPNCGGTNLKQRGFYYTSVGRYQAFRCNDCQAIARARISDLSKKERANLLSPVAR